MIVLAAICVISIVLAAAGWICDRLGDRRDELEQERRRRQALRRCVQRAQADPMTGDVMARLREWHVAQAVARLTSAQVDAGEMLAVIARIDEMEMALLGQATSDSERDG